MRAHQRTTYCRMKQEQANIPKTMERLTWNMPDAVWQLPRYKVPMLHLRQYPIHYKPPGWGRNGSVQTGWFIDTRFKRIVYSNAFTLKEKLKFAQMPVEALEFQAALVFAELANDNVGIS